MEFVCKFHLTMDHSDKKNCQKFLVNKCWHWTSEMPLYLQTHSKCPVEVVLANYITKLDNADHEVFKSIQRTQAQDRSVKTPLGEKALCALTLMGKHSINHNIAIFSQSKF